jgi:hypothetical protein
MTPFKALLLCAAPLLCAASSPAQVLEKIPEVQIERDTELDAAGLRQFVPFEVKCPASQGRANFKCLGCDGVEMPHCTECDGTKLAPCRTCAGTGNLLDPLVEMVCPYCRGSAWYNCAQCNGFGSFGVNQADGSSVRQKCGSCKEQGRFACSVCGGTRKLPSVRVKKKAPTEAALKDLAATHAALAEVLAELETFEPVDRPAKSQKALEKLLAKPKKTLPPLGDMLELLEDVLKGLTKAGAGFQNYEERMDHQLRVFRDRSIYLLRYQLRVLDLCIERAEFNEQKKQPE